MLENVFTEKVLKDFTKSYPEAKAMLYWVTDRTVRLEVYWGKDLVFKRKLGRRIGPKAMEEILTKIVSWQIYKTLSSVPDDQKRFYIREKGLV